MLTLPMSGRDWDLDPSTSTIARVKLQELDFPAITVCPDWATDQLAIQSVYNKSVLSTPQDQNKNLFSNFQDQF